MRSPIVGLLPLYVALYDESVPELRGMVAPFAKEVAAEIELSGCTVLMAPVCCVEREVEQAIEVFEGEEVDAIVTLHLAYSPSLESVEPLAQTDLPIIVLDTTPRFDFGPTTDPAQMMLNHGIHGVQDLCNLLVRREVPFEIQAGHLEYSNVIERLHCSIRGAQVATALRKSRVGLVGQPFVGMGDFRVEPDVLHSSLGITTVSFGGGSVPVEEIEAEQVEAEIRADLARFQTSADFCEDDLALSEQTGLALRAWVANQQLSAISISFMAATQGDAFLPVMPFLECCKLMEKGVGYAGEGDVVTAAWVGAVLSVFPETTFTEMFCPDWDTNSVFLSHMGEFNFAVSAQVPVLHNLAFPYTSAADPVVAYGTLKPGPAVLANFSPIGDAKFRMILSEGTVLPVEGPNAMDQLMNGWFRPDLPLDDFLEKFSEHGGIHHSALIYGDGSVIEVLRAAGNLLNVEVVVL